MTLFFAVVAQANLVDDSWVFHTTDKSYSFKRAGNVRGTPYVCLPEIVKQLGLVMAYNPQTFEVLVGDPKRANYVHFHTYARELRLSFANAAANIVEKKRKGLKLPNVNYTQVKAELSRRPEFVGAELCVPIEFGDRALRPLLSGKAPLTPTFPNDSRLLDRIQVVLDPGHGGNDLGATDSGFREKDLTLAFAKTLQKALQSKGVPTLLTREDDIFITLSERARIANQTGGKLFLSLHMNATERARSLKGYEIYLLSLDSDDSSGRAAVAREQQMIPDDLPEGLERAAADLRASANFERSVKWADVVDKELIKHIPSSSSRSVRSGPFYILYAAQMPALLLELGYITHPKDRERILNLDLRQKWADGLSKKILESLKDH